MFLRRSVSRECRASLRARYSGDRFPAPFAHPPGRGWSSPTVNVVWALFNLVVGYILFGVGKVSSAEDSALVIFFAGLVVISTMLSMRFATSATSRGALRTGSPYFFTRSPKRPGSRAVATRRRPMPELLQQCCGPNRLRCQFIDHTLDNRTLHSPCLIDA